MAKQKAVWVLALVVVAAVVGLLKAPNTESGTAPALAGTSLRGKVAPNFRLLDQFGRRIALSRYRGRPVVVTFLETRCRKACPIVTDTLRQALARLGPGGRKVAVLAVSLDPEGDTPAAVRRFSRTHRMLGRWHYLIGSRRRLAPIWRAYFVYAPPAGASPAVRDAHTSATFLIDRQGRERILLTGVPDQRVLVRDLQILTGLPVTGLAEVSAAPEVQHPAPPFTLSSLTGKPVTLAAFRGKIVLVNFWASWCVPCRTETPMLVRWYQRLRGQGFIVIGIDQQEGPGAVRAFVQEFHVPYPIALDRSGATSATYNVRGLPTSFLLDRTGVVRAVHIGALPPSFLAGQVLPLVQAATSG